MAKRKKRDYQDDYYSYGYFSATPPHCDIIKHGLKLDKDLILRV